MRVLLVEDETDLADAIARGLRREGMAVDVARDGADGLHKAEVNRYDVVCLDRDLPAMHGDTVCRRLVASVDPPKILMLTALGSVEDRVDGLESGADDYLPKPFAFTELVARVRALGRRTGVAHAPLLEGAGIRLDRSRRRAERGGMPLELTPKEFGVLEVLLAADGAVVSAEDLLERVWDEHTDPFTNTVRVTLTTLRRKLGDPPAIETVVGSGYRIP